MRDGRRAGRRQGEGQGGGQGTGQDEEQEGGQGRGQGEIPNGRRRNCSWVREQTRNGHMYCRYVLVFLYLTFQD